MSKKNQFRGQKKVADANAVVTVGLIVDATVVKKGEQSVVLNYAVNGNQCSGVLHVSQFGSTERQKRDQLFSSVQEGQELKNLQVIEVVSPSGDRRFTSVRLSALAPLKASAEEQRKSAEATRLARQVDRKTTIDSLNGKVVTAKVKDLGIAPAKDGKEEHCYGAFLVTDVRGHRISGLLHVSRMLNSDDKVTRLKDAKTAGEELEVVLKVGDDGRIAFSESEVKGAKQKAEQAAAQERKAAERELKLQELRQQLSDGTASQSPFHAKVTVNRLPEGLGLEADYCGLVVKVSNEDLQLLPQDLKGRNHTLKLIALSEENGVITAKRLPKKKAN